MYYIFIAPFSKGEKDECSVAIGKKKKKEKPLILDPIVPSTNSEVALRCSFLDHSEYSRTRTNKKMHTRPRRRI